MAIDTKGDEQVDVLEQVINRQKRIQKFEPVVKAHIDELEDKFEKKEKKRLRDEKKRRKKDKKLRNGGGATEQTKPHYLSYGTSDIKAWPQKKEIESDSQNESA